MWRIACGRLVPEWGKWRDVWAVVSVLHSRRHPLVLVVMSAGCAVVQLLYQWKVEFVCDEGLVVLSARVPVLLVHSEAVMPSCREGWVGTAAWSVLRAEAGTCMWLAHVDC